MICGERKCACNTPRVPTRLLRDRWLRLKFTSDPHCLKSRSCFRRRQGSCPLLLMIPTSRMWLTMRLSAAGFFAFFVASALVGAQSVPAPIYTDPPADPAHPAGMDVLHIPSHGLVINGVMYRPSGPGPHPTLIICHGLPGNEKNLDLGQAVRRAGWNAVTFLSDPVNAAK